MSGIQIQSIIMKNQSGITLIEVLIYIAFFALLVGSLLGVTFQTMASVDQINKKITIQQEGNFILKKLSWTLASASGLATSANSLSVTRYSHPTNIIFKTNGNNFQINDGSGFADLNSSNVKITNVFFDHQVSAGNEWAVVSFNIDGESFSITRYLRR